MIAFTIPNICGTIVLLTVTPGPDTKGGLVAAYYCMQVFGSVSLAVLRMPLLDEDLVDRAVLPCDHPHVESKCGGSHQAKYQLCYYVYVKLQPLDQKVD
jgi:hypothetical protein